MASTAAQPPANDTTTPQSTNHSYLTPADRKQWYAEKIPDSVGWPATRELLINYSKIPEDEVDEHVYNIRSRAWAIHDYPCIGSFRFLDLSIGQAPHYDEILTRVKAGERLLDLGCCFGQDERRLVYDGAPSTNLYACDLRSSFFSLGYELFRDKSTLSAHFFEADIFDENNGQLNDLYDTVDIINASAFFHLFDYDEQLRVGVRVAKLLRNAPRKRDSTESNGGGGGGDAAPKGSLIVGRHMANLKSAGYHPNRNSGGPAKFRHDEGSWREMWRVIGRKTGTKWECEVWWVRREGSRDERLNGDGSCLMKYACRLVEEEE